MLYRIFVVLNSTLILRARPPVLTTNYSRRVVNSSPSFDQRLAHWDNRRLYFPRHLSILSINYGFMSYMTHEIISIRLSRVALLSSESVFTSPNVWINDRPCQFWREVKSSHGALNGAMIQMKAAESRVQSRFMSHFNLTSIIIISRKVIWGGQSEGSNSRSVRLTSLPK
jgi:hypothetical protein